jgi:beta-glucanase (GH16 family)
MDILRPPLKALLFAAALPLVACTPASTARGDSQPTGDYPIVWQPGNWSIVWQDEFDGMAGTAPDATKWAHEVGGDGWGNEELQYYTDGTANVALDGAGNLAITARREAFMGNAYTSARLTTEGLFSQAYGKFEARMQLVQGVGMWPAFWIMGDDIDTVGWPAAGEVDIMEQRGFQLRQIWGSVHGPNGADKDLPSTYPGAVPDDVDTNFHVYGIEWDPDVVTFLVDDHPYAQVTLAHLPVGARWVWDHPFFMIVNLAVGGLFGGDPNDMTPMPQSLLIDYVRVSTRQP